MTLFFQIFFEFKMFSTKILPSICRIVRVKSSNYPQTVLPPFCSFTIVPKCEFSLVAFPVTEQTELLSKSHSCNSISIRSYAKGKDKKKEKGKNKVTIDESQIAEFMKPEVLKNQMQNAIVQLEEDFIKHLSLRSTTGAIESIHVNFDGKDHTLQELAQIVRKNPKTIVVNFTTFPQAIPAALKALAKSGMNLNPQQDGTTLFIPVPKVTKEHREQLSKNAKTHFIKCRDSVRDIQQKFIKQIKKKDKISEDLVRNVEQQIVAIADQFIAEAEGILNRKQNELVGEK